jgi:5-methylcytosine-specific restriction endonuclease McrA
MKIPFISKKHFKRKNRECKICGEDVFELLDTHRVIPGSNNGKYSDANCVCLCTSCHRKHHRGIITIKQWYNSTGGRLLHYIDEDGNEQFK